MKKCRSCKQGIDPQATKCPHCQTDQRIWFRRHPIWTAILVLFILGVIGSMVGGSKSNNTNSVPAVPDKANSNSNTTAATQAPVTQAAPQVLLDVSGSGSKSTQKFTAAGDWDLNWTYDCSNFLGGKGNFMVSIYNGDSSMSVENSGVNQLGSKDSGVEHYHKGGTFYLQVNSECSWTLQAKG